VIAGSVESSIISSSDSYNVCELYIRVLHARHQAHEEAEGSHELRPVRSPSYTMIIISSFRKTESGASQRSGLMTRTFN
jgi:hypothetical protein